MTSIKCDAEFPVYTLISSGIRKIETKMSKYVTLTNYNLTRSDKNLFSNKIYIKKIYIAADAQIKLFPSEVYNRI